MVFASQTELPDMEAVARANETEALIRERHNQHGDWKKQSQMASQLKAQARRGKNWSTLEHHQAEALDMILVKISRILTGDPAYADHWDDIKGYAELGKQGHDGVVPPG